MNKALNELAVTELEIVLDEAYSRGGSWEEAAKHLGISTRQIYYLRKKVKGVS